MNYDPGNGCWIVPLGCLSGLMFAAGGWVVWWLVK